jgi:hypothetical protein
MATSEAGVRVEGISLSCSGGPFRSTVAVHLLILVTLFVSCDLPHDDQ